MNAKFFDLKKEKQDRMINAVLKIFAENGYDHASTDEIVKEAQISKGLLFHYFESKMGVYEFVCDYSVKYFAIELSTAIDPAETSYFAVRKQIEAAKMQTMKAYPYMLGFLESCESETNVEAALAVKESLNQYESALDTILSKTDLADVKQDSEAGQFITMLNMTLSGTMKESLKHEDFSAEALYKTSCKYIDLISKTV